MSGGSFSSSVLQSPKVFTQSDASTDWSYSHNLGYNPVVDVKVNLDGVLQRMIPASIEYPDNNTVVVRFSELQTGEISVV